MGMKLSEFKFDLPSSLIALHPTDNRDDSRLMVVHKDTGEIEHKVFKDVVDYFDEKDVFVINDTKVFPARLYGNKEKTGAKIEVFLLRELNREMKLWDVRATNRPMHVLSPFDAGATCASAHPVHDYLVACGSYDETICLYDIRFLSTKAPVSRSKKLGGGIWRIKWHPYVDQRMLVAAMHGGCRVVEVENWGSVGVPYTAEEFEGGTQFSFQVTKKFTEHDSMAYGADWLVCKHPTRNGFFEAAGSCSFYDRNVFLWDTL